MAGRASMGLLLACIVALSSVHQVVGNVKFVILHFNDFHSRIEGEDEWHGPCQQWTKDQGKCHGGIARMKTAIEEERKKGLPVIVLNAGDDLIGTHWDYAYKGGAAAVFLNQLNITASTVGNHDFDYGPDRLTQYIKSLNYPVTSANLNPNGHEIGNYIKPYVITEVGGTKVGICAVGTEATNTNSHPAPAYMEDHFSKGRECVEKLTNDEGIKIIILLSHEGYNADRYIARDTHGVDVVVGGHSHAMLCSGECPAMSWEGGYAHKDEQWGDYPTWMWSETNNRNIPVVQAGWASRYMGRLEVEFDDNGDLQYANGWPMLLGDWGSANHVTPDAGIEAQIASWKYWE